MSEKITFKELVEKIAEQSQQSYSSTNNFIQELVEIIESGLSESGSVKISGFGKFELRWMKERPGINPQTGEEITIPGQNKVVFKPYKALRQKVNKPYSKMSAQILEGELQAQKKPSEEDESLEDILIERESPVQSHTDSVKDDEKPLALDNQANLTKEVDKSSSMKWSYAAAAIIVLLAFMIMIFLIQQPSEQPSEPALSEQTEQHEELDSPVTDTEEDPAAAADQTEDAPADAPPPPADEEAVPDEDSPQELELISHNVSPGESLWTIAESQLGNPYLWPLIYYLNQDLLDNPNQLFADGNLEIPTISDPENLTDFEQEQVALGYFSLYQWAQTNAPDEARYFLWAVGAFSLDLLEERASEVDAEDLQFATQR